MELPLLVTCTGPQNGELTSQSLTQAKHSNLLISPESSSHCNIKVGGQFRANDLTCTIVWVKHKIEDRLAIFLQICPGNCRRHNHDKRNLLSIEQLVLGQ